MKVSIKRVVVYAAATSLALALVCVTAARAQDADETGAGPTPLQVAGSWTGMDTQGSATGPASLDLAQDGKVVTGTFSITTEGGSGTSTVSGNVKGKASQDHVTLHFHPTSGNTHNCTAKAIATVSGSTMEGAFVVLGASRHCKGRGTFDVTM